MLDKILKKYNLKYEDLRKDERETLDEWMVSLQENQLSIEKIRGYISSMKNAVEQEVTKTDLNSKQDLFLKARLRNYMLLEAFMSTPEKAREQIETALQSVVGGKIDK